MTDTLVPAMQGSPPCTPGVLVIIAPMSTSAAGITFISFLQNLIPIVDLSLSYSNRLAPYCTSRQSPKLDTITLNPYNIHVLIEIPIEKVRSSQQAARTVQYKD